MPALVCMCSTKQPSQICFSPLPEVRAFIIYVLNRRIEKYISKDQTGEQNIEIIVICTTPSQAVVVMVRDLINEHLEKKCTNVPKKEKKAADRQNRDSKTTRGLLDCILPPAFATWRLNRTVWLVGRVGGWGEALCHSKLMTEILIRSNNLSPRKNLVCVKASTPQQQGENVGHPLILRLRQHRKHNSNANETHEKIQIFTTTKCV